MENNQYIELTNLVKKLSLQIDELKKETLKQPIVERRTQSDESKELYTALSKAQSEMPIAFDNSTTTMFKGHTYADYAEIVRTIKCLTKHGLAYLHQILTNENGETLLYTKLVHTTGQWIESRIRIIPARNDIHAFASQLTYLKRYTLESLVGCASSGDDDDGELAVKEQENKETKNTVLVRDANTKNHSYDVISREQLIEINNELSEYDDPDFAQQVLDFYKIKAFANLPKSRFGIVISKIREKKKLRDSIK